jgi:hypothetical protein
LVARKSHKYSIHQMTGWGGEEYAYPPESNAIDRRDAASCRVFISWHPLRFSAPTGELPSTERTGRRASISRYVTSDYISYVLYKRTDLT